MQLRTTTTTLLLLGALAAPAAANPYATFISIDNEEDLYDLQATGQIDDDALANLIELFQRGVDLNKANREEIYELPNLTYAEVDAILEYRALTGWITDPIDLVINGVLSQEKLEAIAAFLVVSDQSRALISTDGWFRSQTRWSPEDEGAPPLSLQARVSTFQNLTVGAAGVLSHNRLDYVAHDPSRGTLTAEEEGTSVHVPKVYAKWETDKWGIIGGTYRIGFGQRLTFDNTSLYTPNGFYLDDELFRDNALTRECKESDGVPGQAPAQCDREVYASPDYRWRDGLLGVAVGAKRLPLGAGRLQAFGFASYAPRSIYQYEIYSPDTCEDPTNDLDEDCAAPFVYRFQADDPLQPTDRFSFQTLPNMYAETTAGGNVAFALSRRSHIGVTGYGSNVDWLVEGMELDFQEWSRYPFGGPFGALGGDAAYGIGKYDFFAEVTRSFDSMGDKGGGWGGVLRQVTSFQKYNELEASLRYYGEDFKNPYARPIAAPDELEGVSARDEAGARLRYTARLRKRFTLRAAGDLWQSPSDGTENGLVYARGDVDLTDQYGVGLWGLYQNKDLSENGLGMERCYESTVEDDEIGEPIECTGEKYQAIGRLRYSPTRRYTLTAQYQHEFLTDGHYDDEYRQDVSAYLIGTARPTDDLRLRGRVRYLVEDISDDMYLEESVWGYADASYRVRARDRVRLRYDVYVYLDDRDSTADREPSPEHWLWLEYESRF